MGSETALECDSSDVESSLKTPALKKHRCTYDGCNSAFNRPWKLERHIYTHTKERPFKCDHSGCEKDYTNKSHLDRHKAISHAEVKPLPVFLNCPYPECNKVYTNKWSLKRHCNTHKHKSTYKCTVCDVTFKKSNQLKTHLRGHQSGNFFSCGICEESFNTKKLLKRHEKKHKLYFCENEGCEQKFNTWNKLRRHEKDSHPKVFICDFCSKSYRNKYNIAEHVLSHLPVEKRDVLVCPYDNCERHYLHQRNLRHHIRSYHQNINHECDYNNCKLSFSNRSKLREHLKRHLEPKKHLLKPKTPRKPRKDKGSRRKSMAAILSGIILPNEIDRSLVENKITPAVLDCIENIKNILYTETDAE